MITTGSPRLDAVRLRVLLTGRDVAAAVLAYQLDARPNRLQQLYLCERPAQRLGLRLVDIGIVASIYAGALGSTGSTVTLRPFRPDQLGASWSAFHRSTHHQLRVEGDWVADRRVVAASLTYRSGASEPATTVVNGDQKPTPAWGGSAMLFSDRQRRFVKECCRGGHVLEPLQLYGPVQVRSWRVSDRQFDLRLQRWSLTGPDRQSPDLMDISVRATPKDAALVQPAFVASVRREGMDPDIFRTSPALRFLDHFLTRP
jgi:hypothetical protein